MFYSISYCELIQKNIMYIMKKKVFAILVTMALMVCCAVPAFAETVYYKGQAVYWDYGRAYEFWSYSNVQTHVFTHSATANDTWSGWQDPGTEAKASQWIGTGHAYAYWDCK